MSEVKRYGQTNYGSGCWVFESKPSGDYVSYEDYAALEQKLTDLEVQLANAESKCRELAAENLVLKKSAEFATAQDMWIEQTDGMLDYRYVDWYVDVLKDAMETPATDAFLAEVLAQGVEMYAEHLTRKTIESGENKKHAYAYLAANFAAQLRKGAAL